MDHSGIKQFLQTISVHYPQFRKHIDDGNGAIPKIVIEEWHRVIGFLDYDEAVARLDQYMASEDGNRQPKPMDLRRAGGSRKGDVFHAPIRHDWHLEFQESDKEHQNGRLYNQHEYEYVFDPENTDPFYYDKDGHICQSGKVVAD